MSSSPNASAPLNLGVRVNINNIRNYEETTYRVPLLSKEDEQALIRHWQATQDPKALNRLTASYLRLVVAIARENLGYGVPFDDLVQEGNVGLLKALQRFDPDLGLRVSTYATQWIKAEMYEYIFRNIRMVKFSTTKAHRKLFYRLGKYMTSWRSMSNADIQQVASDLNVLPEDVREFEYRLRGGEQSIDASPYQNLGEDAELDVFTPAYLGDESLEPTNLLTSIRQFTFETITLPEAFEKLNERERDIIQTRYMEANGVPIPRQVLAERYGISQQRVGQIEGDAIKKLRGHLAKEYANI